MLFLNENKTRVRRRGINTSFVAIIECVTLLLSVVDGFYQSSADSTTNELTLNKYTILQQNGTKLPNLSSASQTEDLSSIARNKHIRNGVTGSQLLSNYDISEVNSQIRQRDKRDDKATLDQLSAMDLVSYIQNRNSDFTFFYKYNTKSIRHFSTSIVR